MKSKDLGLPIDYFDMPELFDSFEENPEDQRKNEAVERLLRENNVKTVSDMTCGTGQQVFHLLQNGYKVVGSDFSPGLIEIAKKKAEEQKLSVEFNEGDVRNFISGKFDAVITIDNAIGHLTKKDFELALLNVHQNLKEEGVYVFDILNLEAMTDEVVKADNQKMSNKRKAADGTVIHQKRHTTIDRDKGHFISDNDFILEKDGELKNIKNRCSLQIYGIDELNTILKRNNFRVIKQFKADAYTFQNDESGYSIMTVAQKT